MKKFEQIIMTVFTISTISLIGYVSWNLNSVPNWLFLTALANFIAWGGITILQMIKDNPSK